MYLQPVSLPLLILLESTRGLRPADEPPPEPESWRGRHRTSHPMELVIDSGAIRGEWLELEGKSFMVFKGIPYAAPPVGALRFQPPIPPAQWRGVMNATQFAASCWQQPDRHTASELGAFYTYRRAEDCLYLNVFAPSEYGNSSYPVIMFIHGGGFQIGSSSDYRHEPILRHFVGLGVVFVTVNYRLGPMGFLSTGDEVLPGNMGLWDLISALSWIQRNAAVFEGDPSRVTLMGHGSGASAASLLALSPRANHLFRSAILLSGTSLSPGALRTTAINATWNLQAALNCRAFNSTELLECLKNRHRTLLTSADRKRVYYDDYQEWVPVVDGYGGVIPDTPDKLFATQPKMPILLGTTRNESALRLMFFGRYGVNVSEVSEKEAIDLAENLTTRYPKFKNNALVSAGCVYEYVKTRTNPAATATDLQDGMLQLFSEFWYHAPTSRLASMYGPQTDVFLYSFDHVPLRFFPEGSQWKGAFHGSELSFLFDIPLRFLGERSDQNWEIDRRVTELFARLLVNFARSGEPTPDDDRGLEFNWTRYDAKQLNYLSVTDNPAMRLGFPFFLLHFEYHWRGHQFWNWYATELNEVDVGNLERISELQASLGTYQLATWSLLFCALFFFTVLVGLACYCTRKDAEEDEF